MRATREVLADKQAHNRQMQFVLGREEELVRVKGDTEQQALRLLEQELRTQLAEMETQNSVSTQRVTPQVMEQMLSQKLISTVETYDSFLEQSEVDLEEEARELEQLSQVLIREE